MTLQKPCSNPVSRLSWLWALLPLLLAAALAIPLLDVDAFNGDEPSSLKAAGIARSGPWSLEEVLSAVTRTSPEQALGWPLLLSAWGRFVGWSELAVRALSLFFGMLTLAWVYRTGRDLLAPRAGLFATLLLGASVFFLAYMIHARAFTLIALCSTLCIWSYWRLVLNPRPTSMGAPAGLLLGSVGLLYSHYFSALFLAALGLFHLLFVQKNRRWWQPVLLLGLAALLATAQLPGFLRGLDKTAGDEALHNQALTAPAVVSHFVHFMTNGLLDLPLSLDSLLLLALPLVLVIVFLRRLRRGKGFNSVWLLVFTSAALLALVIVINEVFRVIVDNRIRYLMPLWPMMALLVGAGLWRLARRYRRLVAVLLALWLVLGAWLTVATDYRFELGFFFHREYHEIYPVLLKLAPKSDLLVFDHSAADYSLGWGYVTKFFYNYKSDPYQYIRPVHANYSFVWFIYLPEDHVGFTNVSQELGRVLCERVLHESGFTFERYALHLENCPDRPVRLVFDSDIQLTVQEISVSNGWLRLDAHFRSTDEQQLASYSLAVHVFDQRGQRVAQGDTGVGPGAIVPLRSEIDISALPPGDYELRVALYDWQTGARLSARDLETDEVSDMHTLHDFRLD